MRASQRTISIQEFAQAMLEADSGFAARVRRFEGRFGRADSDTLAVLAQASYFCWFECEYEEDFVQVCQAIGTGRPTSFYHCGQVSSGRWDESNTYVVAVQRWLGVDRPPPVQLDGGRIEEIAAWLGQHHPAKDALAHLFLAQLVDHLTLRTSFSRMAEHGRADTEKYADFTPWHRRPGGGPYTIGCDYDDQDASRNHDPFAQECEQRVREAMRARPDAGEELISGLLEPSQPPCMHRFSRYQDIKLTSIGVLRWRGSLPSDSAPKEAWQAFFDEAVADARGWLEDEPTRGKPVERMRAALGKPTDRSRTIVRDFLLAEKTDLGTGGYYWVKAKAQKEGITAGAIFKAR